MNLILRLVSSRHQQQNKLYLEIFFYYVKIDDEIDKTFDISFTEHFLNVFNEGYDLGMVLRVRRFGIQFWR